MTDMNTAGVVPDYDVLTVRQLLTENAYLIPIYQRNYAWEQSEVLQLLTDIADAAHSKTLETYYLGTLVIHPRQNGQLETLDGQQRLITLTLASLAFRSLKLTEEVRASLPKRLNLSFERRYKSKLTLQNLARYSPAQVCDKHIQQAYTDVESKLPGICRERELKINEYIEYFLNHTSIIRIKVPESTDLNHYFEIMNSRGVQLEAHEIVKARLLEPLHKDAGAMYAFNRIWEACSRMDRYTQMNFSKSERTQLFSDQGTGSLITEEFLSIQNSLSATFSSSEKKSLQALFEEDEKNDAYSKPWETDSSKERRDAESFGSVINFPNFLLQVLKLEYPEISLDDKTLLKSFEVLLNSFDKQEKTAEFSKDFIVRLLKCRVLFDTYILKRQDEEWSLKKLTYGEKKNKNNDIDYYYYYKNSFDNDDKNREILMLQAMFHVSAPAQNYKNWLFAALRYLTQQDAISGQGLLTFLKNLAKAYMLDRYLCAENEMFSFEEIIKRTLNQESPRHSAADINWTRMNIDGSKENALQAGEKIETFVFNYYDYLLWLEKKDNAFSFGYRNSVEHFYPQHPVNGKPLEHAYALQSFGNLCLVSRSMNSKFSNSLPEAKAANFGSDEALKTYSLKLKEMISRVKDNWDEKAIQKAEQEAKDRILKALENNC